MDTANEVGISNAQQRKSKLKVKRRNPKISELWFFYWWQVDLCLLWKYGSTPGGAYGFCVRASTKAYGQVADYRYSTVMLNQWHGRIVWFSLGFIMWATILRLFGCLASLDGPLVTNSLFPQTACLSTISSGRWMPSGQMPSGRTHMAHKLINAILAYAGTMIRRDSTVIVWARKRIISWIKENEHSIV